MISTSQSSIENSKSSPISVTPHSGVVRRGGIRAHRKNVRPRPASAGHCHPEKTEDKPKHPLLRRRSSSCTNLNWFKNGLEWQTVESSEHLARSNSYKSVTSGGPILDIRHDCVKSNSPTIVHQPRPFVAAPLSAEVMKVEQSGDIAKPEDVIKRLDTETTQQTTSSSEVAHTAQPKERSRLSVLIPGS
ncbi:hypothetical protein BDY19DRAFT_601237 [Irpex rosettiformis]|uniref:Uncharacterized protein n=1 Tax=Irpex rosettiformis TaxID=378272 RepID=A0ACB8TPP1_9APHY|nr:hypothetical protein BDY19DRAFT_601237 [Irpex rosettiformis]